MELPTPHIGYKEGPPGWTGHAQGNGRQAALDLILARTGSTTQQTRMADTAAAVTEARSTRVSGALRASMHGARTAHGCAPQQRLADLRLAMTGG